MADLADHLRKWGLKTYEVDGWKTRKSGSRFDPHAITVHHTAGGRNGNAPSLNIVTHGRPGIPGPLSQFVLGRDGTVFVVGQGRANHGGKGGPIAGVPADSANTYAWGIEAENTGRGEPWSPVQLNAYYRLCAALCAYSGITPDAVFAHKEWAPSRKVDPAGIYMVDFRERVKEAFAAGPAQVVHVELTEDGDPVLREGDEGRKVVDIQNALGLPESEQDGDFGPKTKAAVILFQQYHKIVGDPRGVVGLYTWRALRFKVHGREVLKPKPATVGEKIVNAVQKAAGQWTKDDLRKLQSHLNLNPDGVYGWGTHIVFSALVEKKKGNKKETMNLQRIVSAVPDGIWGPNSERAWKDKIVKLQRVLKVPTTGVVDKVTLEAYRKFYAHFHKK